MLCDRSNRPSWTWSLKCNKSEIKLNTGEIEWKNLMNECLMGEEIFKKWENESEKCVFVNPNSVMDVRHRMVKESTKTFFIPQIQTRTEALKLLRMNNSNRMLKQKEGKMVEKEIARLKETLENGRFVNHGKLNEVTKKRKKCMPNMPILAKYRVKSRKRLELCDCFCEVHTWVSESAQMTMETKINQEGIPLKVKVSLKRQDRIEESLEPAPTPEERSTTNEVECVKQVSEISDGKNEIMRKSFEKSTKSVKKELSDLTKGIFEKNTEVLKMQNKMNQRIISQAWVTWKVYTQQHRSRRNEKKIYKSKIEAFLTKLQDVETREVKRSGKDNNKVIVNCRWEDLAKTKRTQAINEEKDAQLRKLMKEVKASRTEAYQKLHEITKANAGNSEKSPGLKFLIGIEERREERLRRWKEIQERKLASEEEKKKAEKLKEEEKINKEKESKRRKLEELKEKRRLETEKRKAKERENEKLRLNMKVAESQYRKYLLRSYGLRPWIKLIEIRDYQKQRALDFYERNLTLNVFNRLMSNAQEQIRLKISAANDFHERMLKKNFLQLWVDFHKENMEQDQVASDWNEFKITERAFNKWLQFTQDEQLEYLNKKDIALLNYQGKLKRKYLRKLRDYPEFKKLERAKENRKRRWRQRVKEILPDYQPVEA